MRHKKAVAKLGRTTSHRKAMLRNMVTSFFEHERIKTTDAKAKELRKVAEKLITLGKRGDLHARRQALSYIREKGVTAKLFEDIAKRYENREGGYTRILKLGVRRGDNAPISIIELVGKDEKPKKAKKKAQKSKAKKKEAAPAKEEEKQEKVEAAAETPVAETEAPEPEVAEAEPVETKAEAPEPEKAEATDEEPQSEPEPKEKKEE